MAQHDYTEHHIKPQSRGGQKTTELPKEFHQAWHSLFANMYGEEIVVFVRDIQKLIRQKDKVKSSEIHDLKQEIKSGNLNQREGG